jgi:hypothetical protein
MKIKKVIFALAFILLIVSAIFFAYSYFLKEKFSSSFKVDSVLLKKVVKEGENSTLNVKIINLGNESKFNLRFSGAEIFYLNEQTFILNNLESREVDIIINKSYPGIYTGALIISKDKEEKIIPLVFEVQTKEVFFVVNSDINAQYKSINPGEEFITDVKFFNLKDKDTHQISVKYEIKNIENKIIDSEIKTENIAPRTSFPKSFLIPKQISAGDYIFTVFVEYKGFISTSSDLFSVSEKRKLPDFLNLNFFILIVVLFLFVILFLLFYLFYERNKLFFKLRKQHSEQIKIYSQKIDLKEKESIAKARTEKEKKKIIHEFSDAKKKIIGEIKKEQKKQKSNFEKLKKSKDKKFIEKKISEWDYKTYPKAIKSAEIKQKLKMKLGALEHAYSEGYISEGAYTKVSSRIKSATNKLKGKSL